MNDFFFIWIIIALIFILLELGHPSLLLFLSFSCGALGTALLSLFLNSLIGQCVSFLTISMIAFIVLIKYVGMAKNEQHVDKRTNTHALIGKRAVVVRDITLNSPGEVKIGGELWMARLSDHDKEGQTQIIAGGCVIIVDVRGAHVVVVPA